MGYKALANIHAGRLIPAGSIIQDSEYDALPAWIKKSFQLTSQPPATSAAPQTLKADDEHPSADRVSTAVVPEEVVTDNPDRQFMNKKKKKK